MQRYSIQLVVTVLFLATSPLRLTAADGAAVSGVVRDGQGVAQMGALVQLLTGGSATVGTAFTDLHGRYVIANVHPGSYEVRASAALFVPAQRRNLLLRSGARTVVNLTLNALFDSAAWLPAERRGADEPGDDWKWTLRSAANRPIFKMVDDGNIVLISSSAAEHTRDRSSAKEAVTGGDGTFGRGGIHNILTLDKVLDDGSDVIFRAEMGAPSVILKQGPSTEMQTGYQRRLGREGASKVVASFQSHPEIVQGPAGPGLSTMQVASAQRLALGDTIQIEAGSALELVKLQGYLAATRPFVRVKVHPGDGWALGYRMATSRTLQAFEGLDMVQPALPVAMVSGGRMRTESGLHQEVSVSKEAAKSIVQLAYYHDALNSVAVFGLGASGYGIPADHSPGSEVAAHGAGMLVDSSNGSFRTLAPGYSTQGISLTLTQALSPSLWAALQYSTGDALRTLRSGPQTRGSMPALKASGSETMTVALRGRIVKSGTNVRALYRWQPIGFVTAVDPYAAFSDQAYFSFFVRQQLHCGSWLPPGFEATMDVTNLLAQGYRPFLSSDGKTLYLAQSPRAIQAGLAFNF